RQRLKFLFLRRRRSSWCIQRRRRIGFLARRFFGCTLVSRYLSHFCLSRLCFGRLRISRLICLLLIDSLAATFIVRLLFRLIRRPIARRRVIRWLGRILARLWSRIGRFFRRRRIRLFLVLISWKLKSLISWKLESLVQSLRNILLIRLFNLLIGDLLLRFF